MAEDDEIDAMKKIAAALEPLGDAARRRALQWAVSRFRSVAVGEEPIGPSHAPSQSGPSGEAHDFQAFADLFEAANPKTDREKALIAAYWVQVCQAQPFFASQALNSELKDLGHGVGNITEALTGLRTDRPALALQLKKSGNTRQARKTYKLTQEGVRRVQTMLRGGELINESD